MKPSKRQGNTRHILFIADFAYSTCRPILSGVISRLSSRPDVRLLVRSAHPDDADLEHAMENVDGVISCIGANDRRVQWFSAGRRGPHLALVYGGAPMPSARRRAAKFLCDNKAVGRAAAELLARHDLASFGYIGARVASNLLLWDAERRDAFLAALNERGLSASVFATATDPANVVADTVALGDWLKNLHYPCGVFVVNDERALEVLGVCHAAGIAVPEQVQIVGVDNEPWICEKTTPTLTSIEPDFEGAGWQAADAILALMEPKSKCKIENVKCKIGDQQPSTGGIPAIQTFGVRRVVQRMSTTDTHGHAGRAVRARDYISAHANERISVAELAKKLCCSVRTLQVSYSKVFGMQVSAEITAAKVALAQKLLAGDTPIDEIPEKVGYESPHHFKLVFKARTGMTMSQFRRCGRFGRSCSDS
jgi:LacI family transcriptional regulator